MRVKFEEESKLALSAVSLAGSLATDNPEKTVLRSKESNRDVVTEIDIEIEKLLLSKLTTSEFKCVGEESVEKASFEYLKDDKPVWFIDPLDGTTNFVSGLPLYAISVGLISRSSFLVAAVNVPSMKELFFTYGSEASYLNGKKLTFTKKNPLKTSLIAANFSSKEDDPNWRQKQYMVFGELNDQSRGVLRLGSAAINTCYVAAGKLDATYGLNIPLWDIAGGLTLAKHAGCDVWIDFKTNLRCDFIVGSKLVVQEIHSCIKGKGLL